jgi:hypothetical protein
MASLWRLALKIRLVDISAQLPGGGDIHVRIEHGLEPERQR